LLPVRELDAHSRNEFNYGTAAVSQITKAHINGEFRVLQRARLLQLGVFGFGGEEDGDGGVGVFP